MIAEPQATCLALALETLRLDSRIVGVAGGGSLITGAMDDYSDLDLIVVVEPAAYEAVLHERRQVAASLGALLADFTGEHVGEPRLLICLYRSSGSGSAALLHVDLKFVSLADVADRVEDPVVLWERDGRLTAALATEVARYPQPDLQWIEDRFWIWVHYGASKIGRGELHEALDFLSFLRARALGPLARAIMNARPSGVRGLELTAPDFAAALERTVATHQRESVAKALAAAVDLYRTLRAQVGQPNLRTNPAAEEAAVAYLSEIAARVDRSA